jgi:hypothetical protein
MKIRREEFVVKEKTDILNPADIPVKSNRPSYPAMILVSGFDFRSQPHGGGPFL